MMYRMAHFPSRRTFLAGAVASGLASAQKNQELLVYIGTYTNRTSKGIYACRLNPSTGKLTEAGVVAETQSPSFLAISPDQRYLYAANEIGNYNGEKSGSISAYSIDRRSGQLKLLSRVSSKGEAPCHVSLDKAGKVVLAANYMGGNVAAFRVKDDGSIAEASSMQQHQGAGPNPRRQAAPHAHSANVSADSRFAIVADLGLDQLKVYKLDTAAGTLTPNNPPAYQTEPGAGPRHFAFHPNGKWAYVINELNSTVSALSYDSKQGSFQRLQSLSTLPEGFNGQNSTADIHVHPNGKFVYGSNRGHNSIAVFAVNSSTGKLDAVEQISTQGKTPRNFGIDPSGNLLLAANQDSDNVVVFRIDAKSGRLTPAGEQISVSAPVCVKFVRPA